MNVVSPSIRRQREDVALLWVHRLAAEPGNLDLDETRLSAAEQRDLQHWLDSDPANAAAYASACEVWRLTGLGAQRLAREESEALQALLRRGQGSAPRRRWMPVALAASVFLAAALALLTRPERWLDNLADYHTGPGQLQSVSLADGSEVLLDGDSAIDVTLTEHSRDIELLRGAAFFRVKHNGLPFVVHAQGGAVSVLGTRFEVRRQDAGAQVTVEEGRVAVKPQADANAQLLSAAQRVEYRQGQGGALVTVNPEQAFGWRDGRVSFRRTPLVDALAVVQRYYPGRIVLLDSALGARQVSGDFASNDPQAMLAAFQGLLGYAQQRLPGGMLVIR